MSMVPKQRSGARHVLLALCLLVGANAFAQSASYSYDSLNRLTRVVYADGTRITYTYDAAGNRLTMATCNFVLSATAATFATAGGPGTVDVTTVAGCDWTAVSGDSFLSLTGGASGSGNGVVTYGVAANGTGSDRSGTLTIAGKHFTVTQSAAIAPAITMHPSNTIATSGGTATFTVAASGTPAPAFQWQIANSDGSFSNLTETQPYANVTTATLTVTASAELNDARYRAVATNTVSPPATSNTATLTVNFAPAITTQPSSQTVTSGANATFTVAAGGNPTPTIRWQVSNGGGTFTNLTDAPPYSNVTTSSLTVATSAILDGAQYRAVATNTIAPPATSAAATLTVHFAPAITAQPSNATVVSGSNATFTVAASGNPDAAYQWQISNGDGTFSNLAESSPYSNVTTTTLTVAASSDLDGAQYRAVATNAISPPATSEVATLTVNSAPTITSHPSNATVMSGSDATFMIAGSGKPSPTIQWQVSSGDGTFSDLTEGAPYSNVTTATLTVSASPGINGTRYRAVATNTVAPPATSNAATLTVNLSPGPDSWVDALHGNDANAGSSLSPFRTISQALTAIGANGTIHVGPGTYNTSLGEAFPLTIPSGIKLQSTAGAATTIIDAHGAKKRVLYLTANSDATLVEGFTITGGFFTRPVDGGIARGGGILTENDDRTTISRCVITRNEVHGYAATGGTYLAGGSAYGGGISIDGQTKLINCIISGNIARGGNGHTRLSAGDGGTGGEAHGGAVWASDLVPGHPAITNCTFNANQTIGGNGGNATVLGSGGAGGAAFYTLGATNATMVNNIISNNVVAAGSGGSPGGSAGLPSAGGVNAGNGTHNLFFNNTGGNGFVGTSTLTGLDPLYANPPGDLHPGLASPARMAGTSSGAPSVDLDANPRPILPAIGAYEIGMFLTATGGIGRITVTWPAVPGATSYNLYMAGSSGVTTSSTTIAGAVSPHVLFPLANDIGYFFRISGIENGVEGPLSPEVAATTSKGSWVRGALADGGSDFTNVTRDLADGTVLYATANDSMGLYKSLDAGDSWTAVIGPFNGYPIRAVAANGSTVLVAGHGAIYRSSDRGSTWSTSVTGAGVGEDPVNSLAIDPLAVSNIYGGDFHIDGGSTSSDLLAKSSDGGLTFSNLTDATAHDLRAHFLQIDPAISGTLYAAGSGTPKIARSVNNGSTWSSVSLNEGDPTALVLGPDSTLYAGLQDADSTTSLGVFKTTDSGSNWNATNVGFPVPLPAIRSLLIDSDDPSRVHAGTSQGHYVSTDGSASWASGPPNAGGLQLNALAQSSTRRLIGTAANGIWILPLGEEPSINDISPTSAGVDGGVPVTVTGSGFAIGSRLRVLFGGSDGAIELGTSNNGSIRVTPPAHAPGEVDVAVINSDGQSAILANGFTFNECSYSISPTSADHTPATATGAVLVTAASGCEWTASAPVGSFVSITEGTSGNGNGTVSYSVAANSTASARSTTMTIAGFSFQANQSASVATSIAMTATASPESVSVTWSALAPATSYEVRRSNNGGAFTVVTATNALTYQDNTISNGTGYLYQIHAIAGAQMIGSSNVDLAVPFTYSYPSIASGGVIRAADFTELRQAVTAARAAVGLPAISFSGSISAGTKVQIVHLQELRSNVDAVRTAAGLPPLSHTDSNVSTSTTIKAAHVVELRNGLK